MVHPQEMMDLYAPGISLGLKKQSPGSYYRRPFNPLSSPSHVACTTKATSVCFLCGGVSEAGDSDVWESRIFFLDGFLLKTQFPVSLSTLYADYLLYSKKELVGRQHLLKKTKNKHIRKPRSHRTSIPKERNGGGHQHATITIRYQGTIKF
ncbi:unnamed protein product [Lactuca virosa]|uniref:Uncharacterized protein n=1 Tax=Lactuca virosa TaxID=75947 RepID=A0AAU9P5U0_9ASTR|nr:unnamed protein product [Lactuca virosa]